MSKTSTTLIAALAVASLLVAVPALAAKGDVRAATSDANPGGEAYFLHTKNGLVLKACDIQKDGHSAWAYASYGKTYENTTGDVNGSRNSCESRRISAAPGRTVYVRVCLADRDGDNVLKHCSAWKRGRA
jgi:hypothetical protein